METRAHHVIIGAFAIGVFVLALGFVMWLSKSSIDREFAYYDIIFTEAVTGLGKGGTGWGVRLLVELAQSLC